MWKKGFVIFALVFLSCTAHTLPEDGPAAELDKRIFFVASDLRNGGVKATSDSFVQAAKNLKWKVDLVDSVSNKGGVIRQLKSLLDNPPDGVVVAGFDGADFRDVLKKLRNKGVKIVGWHAASKPGPTADLFTNVTTDAVKVAEVAAQQLKNYGAPKGGVIMLTARDYSIATTKTLEMKKAVETMENCKLLAVEDLAFSEVDKEIPHLVKAWNQRYGKTWTHTLAINDIYFERMWPALKAVHREDVVGIAAGDGSEDAIFRVGAVKSAQMVTVAEPLKTHGWQLADELNRAFAGEPPSAYVSEPLVITKKYLKSLKSGDVEENIPYRERYLRIWFANKKVTEI